MNLISYKFTVNYLNLEQKNLTDIAWSSPDFQIITKLY